jgi:hypothetical protein
MERLIREYNRRERHLLDMKDRGKLSYEDYVERVFDIHALLILALSPTEKAARFLEANT